MKADDMHFEMLYWKRMLASIRDVCVCLLSGGEEQSWRKTCNYTANWAHPVFSSLSSTPTHELFKHTCKDITRKAFSTNSSSETDKA